LQQGPKLDTTTTSLIVSIHHQARDIFRKQFLLGRRVYDLLHMNFNGEKAVSQHFTTGIVGSDRIENSAFIA
jgi:hypothetical protein